MKENRIMGLCKNFDKIVNFKALKCDTLTLKLISIYQEYVFTLNPNNEDEVRSLIKLDGILNKYLEDYIFRKEFQKQILTVEINKESKNKLKDFVHHIINIFNNYKEGNTRVIYISHWI